MRLVPRLSCSAAGGPGNGSGTRRAWDPDKFRFMNSADSYGRGGGEGGMCDWRDMKYEKEVESEIFVQQNAKVTAGGSKVSI